MEVPKIYPCSNEINFKAIRSFDWEGDILSVTDSMVSAFQDATDAEILQHYQTDFTELREFLEAKRAGKELRPVVRGKWISHDFVDMGKGRYTGSVECPVCHRFLPVKENFCPNCGADMRQCPEDEAAEEMASVRWWPRREES